MSARRDSRLDTLHAESDGDSQEESEGEGKGRSSYSWIMDYVYHLCVQFITNSVLSNASNHDL